MDPQTTGNTSSDALRYQLSSLAEQQKLSASNTIIKEKPFDFLQAFYDAAIAGAVAGVVVETALYPIDTIKTRLQAAHGGGKIILKGLYSGLSGNLAGVLPASAIFLGVYEPIKQNLLTTFPEKFSALAHLISLASNLLDKRKLKLVYPAWKDLRPATRHISSRKKKKMN